MPGEHKTPSACWAHKSRLQIGTLNCRGLRGDSSRAKKSAIIYGMKKLKLDLLFLQETHVNTNSAETMDGFTFIFSTSITDEQRKQAENQRAAPRRGQQPPAVDMEYGGVGVILSPHTKTTLKDFEQIDGRLMTVTLDAIGPPIHFLNAYAPQSGVETRIKQAFYTKLHEVLTSIPGAHPTLVLGDFNARMHARLPQEDVIAGTYIFGRGMNFLSNNISPPSLENRCMFVEFCIDNSLVVGNTLFQKPPQKQITYREAGVSHGPPWAPDRYAQLDMFLVPERWKNSLLDVSACPEIFVDSDHYIVAASFVINKKKNPYRQDQEGQSSCFRTQTSEPHTIAQLQKEWVRPAVP